MSQSRLFRLSIDPLLKLTIKAIDIDSIYKVNMFEKKPEPFPDRPLECGGCKKPIAVRYTEIVSGIISHTSMCADCPELQRRLHGKNAEEETSTVEGSTGVCCGQCGTTLDEVRRGHRLGCMECYEVFGDVLITEMLAAGRLPSRLVNQKKAVPAHIGRVPGESQSINPSSRLLALNEALKETLSREDYEQAAWLRDQIKELTENERKQDERQE